jgi:hypothetical protein
MIGHARTTILVLAALMAALAVGVAVATAGTYTGSITNSDPSHTDFANFAAGGPSACGPTPAYPGTNTNNGSYHYDTITEVNTTGSDQCVTITVDNVTGGANSAGVAVNAYLGSFNPANLGANYAGGANSQIPVGGSATFGVTVPDGQTLVVEIEEYVAGTGAASYTVTISGLTPTAVQVRSFTAAPAARGTVLRWRTASEAGLLGFNVYRGTGARTRKLNHSLIRAKGGAAGASYSWLHRGARAGSRYRLQIVNADGTRHWYGVVRSTGG